ncbi:hypothetical protein CCHR01_07330 [Colletotrichum chrysophilum]|uniref:Uncharacterized protein n=1 Tax=Colletotrichum chrysophilum TaxID=1836956 RepID=A0AAD9EMJ7_9PEZI|nr:hypothetical protein CCHR01_07330 [Colletotrichum chrysophilum]
MGVSEPLAAAKRRRVLYVVCAPSAWFPGSELRKAVSDEAPDADPGAEETGAGIEGGLIQSMGAQSAWLVRSDNCRDTSGQSLGGNAARSMAVGEGKEEETYRRDGVRVRRD